MDVLTRAQDVAPPAMEARQRLLALTPTPTPLPPTATAVIRQATPIPVAPQQSAPTPVQQSQPAAEQPAPCSPHRHGRATAPNHSTGADCSAANAST